MFGVASQVILSVLASTLIGGVLGWQFRGRQIERSVETAEESWRRRLRASQRQCSELEERLEENAVRITGLETDLTRALDALKGSGTTRRSLETRVAELTDALTIARGGRAIDLERRINELENLIQQQQDALTSLRSDLITAREAEAPGAGRIRTLNAWIHRLEEQLGSPGSRGRYRSNGHGDSVTQRHDPTTPESNGTQDSDDRSGSPPPT